MPKDVPILQNGASKILGTQVQKWHVLQPTNEKQTSDVEPKMSSECKIVQIQFPTTTTTKLFQPWQ